MTRQQKSNGKGHFRYGIFDMQFPAVVLAPMSGRARVWVHGKWRCWSRVLIFAPSENWRELTRAECAQLLARP